MAVAGSAVPSMSMSATPTSMTPNAGASSNSMNGVQGMSSGNLSVTNPTGAAAPQPPRTRSGFFGALPFGGGAAAASNAPATNAAGSAGPVVGSSTSHHPIAPPASGFVPVSGMPAGHVAPMPVASPPPPAAVLPHSTSTGSGIFGSMRRGLSSKKSQPDMMDTSTRASAGYESAGLGAHRRESGGHSLSAGPAAQQPTWTYAQGRMTGCCWSALLRCIGLFIGLRFCC